MRLNYILGLGIFLSLAGVSLLLAFGLVYLKPYLNVKNFKEALCTTVSLKLSETRVLCECAADGSASCQSQYPCVRARVNFTAVDNDLHIVNVTLYDSFETFYLQNSTLQCSYHKCNRLINDNIESAKEFYRRPDTNSTYQCYYNVDEPNFALLDVITLSTVINCLFWPSLAFIIGITLFFAQMFHMDTKKKSTPNTSSSSPPPTQKNQFSSLERQWARIKDRSYGCMTSTGSERLVPTDAIEGASHNVVCIQN